MKWKACAAQQLTLLLSLGCTFKAALGAQAVHHTISSITICSPTVAAPQGSCAPGMGDTFRRVLAPAPFVNTTINNYGNLATLSDEHITVFPPGTFPNHPSDYLFFVATKSTLQTLASGLTVLTGFGGPDGHGQWTFDFASDFGQYQPSAAQGATNGQLFLAAMAHDLCPSVFDARFQDETFDLNYADPGTVFLDPTAPAFPGGGTMQMIYEGTSRCVGLNGGASESNFYSTIGVATSFDFGHTWPTYRRNWVPLPNLNQTNGPEAPLGALGPLTCLGNFCGAFPPLNFGRYAAITPPLTLGAATLASSSIPGGLQANLGNAEPSAFVDDASPRPDRYVYVVTGYVPGAAGLGAPRSNPQLPNGGITDLVVSRARLNGAVAPLQFVNWYSGSFNAALGRLSGATCTVPIFCQLASNQGLGALGGGLQTPILPFLNTSNAYQSCQDPTTQARIMGSISYVEDTQQYLLLFVCTSHIDPVTGATRDPFTQSPIDGAAWFYSTIDATTTGLYDQTQWSQPQMIQGSWNVFGSASQNGCARDNKGWYPTIMSLGQAPGHLSTTGYIFYMEGCTDGPTTGGRMYESRVFTITTN
jgi:hypothetical protein